MAYERPRPAEPRRKLLTLSRAAAAMLVRVSHVAGTWRVKAGGGETLAGIHAAEGGVGRQRGAAPRHGPHAVTGGRALGLLGPQHLWAWPRRRREWRQGEGEESQVVQQANQAAARAQDAARLPVLLEGIPRSQYVTIKYADIKCDSRGRVSCTIKAQAAEFQGAARDPPAPGPALPPGPSC